MVRWPTNRFIRVALVAFLQPTWALASQYLWNANSNFTPARNCQVKQVNETGFKVLLSPFSKAKKLVLAKSGEKNQPTITVSDIGSGSQRMVPTSLLADIAEYVLEVNPKKIPKQLGSNFWQVATGDNKYFTYNCSQGGHTKEYLVFNVFAADSQLPVAQVGVAEKDAGLFSDAVIHVPEKADAILDKKLESQIISGRRPQAPTPAPTPENRPVSVEPKKTDKPEVKTGQEGPVVQTSDLEVVCSNDSVIPVYDETLTKVVFTVTPQSEVRSVQDWDKKEYKKNIGGTVVIFEKVQFPNREFGHNVGFISQSLIKNKKDCKAPEEKLKKLDEPNLPVHSCCVFPTIGHPTRSYREGLRRFGASRSGGKRLHAACDLYRYKDEDIVSVAQGIVIRNKYYFYQGTYALEVRHDSGFVVRYGEVTGKSIPGITSGASVKPGQTIALMGKVNSGCCDPMLHFELYAGTVKGSLTQPKRKGFQRRSDLMNPTGYLRLWERQTFGESY